MVERAVNDKVEQALKALDEAGFAVSRAILYGSQARGTPHENSDIDLLLLSPQFEEFTWEDEAKVWRIAQSVDWRIEPVLYGEKQYEENDWHPLILVAKQEGIEIRAPKKARLSRGSAKKSARRS